MEYNTSRSNMNISEYGRNIQKMIEYTMTVDDREKRNKLARATINIMGQLNPHLRDVTDFKHKLWDHLFIMSDFKLDVDSPYPKPSAEILTRKPEKLKYNNNDIKFKHYGRNLERMIAKAIEFPEGEEKSALIKLIANHMKKSYLTWNRESVNDNEIAEHLSILSDGKLKLDKDVRLNHTSEILSKNKRRRHQQKHSSSRNQHYKGKRSQQ